jgi:cellulose synthase/poly-beta-1,6-N-acetylglucosamine synthase-like glycosyltransferase
VVPIYLTEDMVTTVLDIIFLILGLLFLSVLFYLSFLALVSIWPEKQRSQEFSPTIKFAIVIPANNESRVIGQILNNLKQIDYPEDLFNIFVIADNCEDNTAEISRRTGATCWERYDPVLRGKGHVLQWAFKRLLQEGDHGAFVVVDADTLVDRNFLKAMNQRILEGAKAIQGYYDVLNPESSPMGSLSYLGFVISRNLRYKGRTKLGWTTNLLGNGMCFTREVIQRFGWCATSIVEDIEYEMILLLNDIRIVFAPEARIYAEIPDTFSKSKAQRGRWDIGKFEVRNRYLFKLIRKGLKNRDFSYFDSALELIIPPFSLFVILVLTCYFLFFVLDFHGLNLNFYLMTFLLSGLIAYTLSGLVLARASLKIYLSLVYAPYFLLWRFWILLQEIWHGKHSTWIKTVRK